MICMCIIYIHIYIQLRGYSEYRGSPPIGKHVHMFVVVQSLLMFVLFKLHDPQRFALASFATPPL